MLQKCEFSGIASLYEILNGLLKSFVPNVNSRRSDVVYFNMQGDLCKVEDLQKVFKLHRYALRRIFLLFLYCVPLGF